MRRGRGEKRGRRIWGRVGFLLGTLVLVGIEGCSGSGGVEAHPVRGKLLFRGEPTSGAYVVLHSLTGGGAERPTAQVGTDGAFQVTTHEAEDGAPVGEYAVTVEWWRLRKEGNDMVAGPNVIPAIYSKAESTPLRITVREGDNELDTIEIR